MGVLWGAWQEVWDPSPLWPPSPEEPSGWYSKGHGTPARLDTWLFWQPLDLPAGSGRACGGSRGQPSPRWGLGTEPGPGELHFGCPSPRHRQPGYLFHALSQDKRRQVRCKTLVGGCWPGISGQGWGLAPLSHTQGCPGTARRDSHALTCLPGTEGTEGLALSRGCALSSPQTARGSSAGGHPRPPPGGCGFLSLHGGLRAGTCPPATHYREQQKEADATPAVLILTGDTPRGRDLITKAASRWQFLPCLHKEQPTVGGLVLAAFKSASRTS